MTGQPVPRPHLDPGGQEIAPPPDPVAAMAAAAARFDAAIERPAHEGGRGDDAEVLRLLAEADITGIGRVVYSSNAVFLIELDAPDPGDGDERMRAIYKPRRGERPLWDFPRDSLHLREVAAYRLDAALGLGVVPPTTLRRGPHGPGSVQLFIRNSDIGMDAADADAQIHGVATFDVVANNADRKREHLLLGPGPRIWAIDNALTFLPYPRQRTVLLSLGGTDLPDAAIAALRRITDDPDADAALQAELSRLIESSEAEATRERLGELAAAPVYPVLDPWDGRPWEGW